MKRSNEMRIMVTPEGAEPHEAEAEPADPPQSITTTHRYEEDR